MIEVEKLTRTYRTSEVQTDALRDVSLTVAAGEFVAVMGPSGCGKSSLLNVLGCLDAPDAGSYRLFGHEVAGLADPTLTRLRRAHIAFVFQNFNLIDDLTVSENIEMSLLYRTGTKQDASRVSKVLEQVGMAHRAGHRPQQLSGGQQQRVAVARALVAQPDLILADEPTGNLDSVSGDAVIDLLKAASVSGTTIVMVTHSPLHAAAADRIVRMLDGRIVGETRL